MDADLQRVMWPAHQPGHHRSPTGTAITDAFHRAPVTRQHQTRGGRVDELASLPLTPRRMQVRSSHAHA